MTIFSITKIIIDLFLLANFSLLASGQKQVSSVAQPRIVGGTEVDPGAYPWFVSIVDGRGEQLCGGSVIASKWILTAAHCRGQGAFVQIGRHDLDSKDEDFENIPIESEFIHPLNCPQTKEYDIMLIKLQWPSSAKTVTLASGDTDISPGTDVVVMGWGSIYFGGPTSNVLREVGLDVLDHVMCENLYMNISPITDDMLCAAREGGDACQGDSGGPLIKFENGEPIQVGIVSWGVFCADPLYPGVYARVTKGKPWIKEIIRNDGVVPVKTLVKYRTKQIFEGGRRLMQRSHENKTNRGLRR